MRCTTVAALCLTPWLALACGGSQAERPEPAKPRLPDVPDDPLALVPGEPSSLLHVDLVALRASPHYERLARWAESHGCAHPGPGHWLLERAEQGLLAQYPATAQAQPEVLSIVHGNFEPGSAAAALSELSEATGQGAAPAKEREAGRFHVSEHGTLSAVQLTPHLLALGDTRRVQALLDVADGRAAAGGLVLREAYGGRAWLEGHMLALLSAPDAHSARTLQHRLSAFGAARLGAGLGKRPLGIGLSLAADPRLELRIGYGEPEEATAAVAEAQKLAWQANLVLRLAGLPPVLDRVEMRADGDVAELSLELRRDEAEKLLDRAERLLRAQTRSRCGGGQEV